MKETIDILLSNSVLSKQLYKILVADYIRVGIHEDMNTALKGVLFYSSDRKKLNAIRCSLEAIRSSAPKLCKDFECAFKFLEEMPNDKFLNSDYIIDLDNFDEILEQKKLDTRITDSRTWNCSLKENLGEEVKAYNESRETEDYAIIEIEKYQKLKKKAEEQRIELELKPFQIFREGQKKESDQYLRWYSAKIKNAKEELSRIRAYNSGIDELVTPREIRIMELERKDKLLNGGIEKLVEYYEKTIEKNVEKSI